MLAEEDYSLNEVDDPTEPLSAGLDLRELELLNHQLVDPATGEIIRDYRNEDLDDEWADTKTRQLAELESQLEAEQIRHKDLVANSASRVAAKQRAVDSFNYRFLNLLKEYSKKRLTGKEERFVQTSYRRLQWKWSPPALYIKDEELAAAYLADVLPDAVKQSVLVSLVHKAVKSGEIQKDDLIAHAGFDETLGSDDFCVMKAPPKSKKEAA